MKKNIKFYHYFAYGSNMRRRRLEERVGKVRQVGVKILENYEVSFNYGNPIQSFANIIPKKGGKVVGIVYLLTESQIKLLDFYEGTYNPKFFYKRIEKIIDKIPHQIYISDNIRKEFEQPVLHAYKVNILLGYKNNNLECKLKFK